MGITFVDRESTYPGRYKATKTDGTSEYLTLERADEPTVEGTPLNAVTLNGLARGNTPRNLLDNSDFTNPVNQRNVDSSGWIDGNGVDGWIDRIGIDRWYAYNSKAEVHDGYIRIPANGRMVQITNIGNRVAGRNYTVAIGRYTSIGITIISGVVTVPSTLPTSDTELGRAVSGDIRISLRYSPSSGVYFDTRNTSQTTGCDIVWAALYEGNFTTETLPEYQAKGYGAELAECQRYYLRVGSKEKNSPLCIGVGYSSTSIYAGIPGLSMRGIYSANMVTDISTLQYTKTTIAAAQSASSVSAYNAHTGNIVSLMIGGAFEASTPYTIWLMKGVIEFSAER